MAFKSLLPPFLSIGDGETSGVGRGTTLWHAFCLGRAVWSGPFALISRVCPTRMCSAPLRHIFSAQSTSFIFLIKYKRSKGILPDICGGRAVAARRHVLPFYLGGFGFFPLSASVHRSVTVPHVPV
jgi:hypothetical protein